MSRIIRRIHMYTALFVTPWVLMYAASTMVMNHHMSRGETRFNVVEQHDMPVDIAAGETRNEVARRLLADLDLEGRHGVWGSVEDGSIGIHRHRALQDQLVKVEIEGGSIAIEEEDFDLVRILNRMHRRRGYDHGYFQDDAWSFSVDLFIAAMLFWAGSGLWMWWELKVTRRWGAVAIGSGLALFALFLMTI